MTTRRSGSNHNNNKLAYPKLNPQVMKQIRKPLLKRSKQLYKSYAPILENADEDDHLDAGNPLLKPTLELDRPDDSKFSETFGFSHGVDTKA